MKRQDAGDVDNNKDDERAFIVQKPSFRFIASVVCLLFIVCFVWPTLLQDLSYYSVYRYTTELILVTVLVHVVYNKFHALPAKAMPCHNDVLHDIPEIIPILEPQAEVTEAEATAEEQSSQTVRTCYIEQVNRLKKRHQKEMRTYNREMRVMRKRFSEQYKKTKETLDEKNSLLARLQLKIPQLHKEKSSLTGEKEAIEKQLEEEKQRHQELTSKYMKIHKQMMHESQMNYYYEY